MASDSKATSVMVSTSAAVRRRRPGAHTPSPVTASTPTGSSGTWYTGLTGPAAGAEGAADTGDMLVVQRPGHRAEFLSPPPHRHLVETVSVNVAARIAGSAARHDREDALVRSLLTSIVVFRWLVWAWAAVLLVVNRGELRQPGARPWLALALVGAALLVTVADTALLSVDASRLLTLPVIVAEVAVAAALEIGDELAYNGVSHPQSLASAWPLAGVMTAGIAFRARGGVLAGATIGLA